MPTTTNSTETRKYWTRQTTYRLVVSALFLSLGYVLPFLTGQIQEIGSMLLPMHLPVMLCGLVCGWKYGLAVGFILPLTRSLIFGMPVMFPMAVSMAFELATYGFIIGLVYSLVKKQNIVTIYISLLSAMVMGRLVWGVVQAILLGATGSALTFQVFMASALLNAVPGIVVQLILVPAILLLLDKTHLLPFRKHTEEDKK